MQLSATVWHPVRVDQSAARVLNVGLGGAGIASPVVLREADRVMITFLSPSLLDPLPLAARVAWSLVPEQGDLFYAGLAFEAPDRAALLTLFQLIGTLTY